MSALCVAMCLVFRLQLAKLNYGMDTAEAEQGVGKGHRYML